MPAGYAPAAPGISQPISRGFAGAVTEGIVLSQPVGGGLGRNEASRGGPTALRTRTRNPAVLQEAGSPDPHAPGKSNKERREF